MSMKNNSPLNLCEDVILLFLFSLMKLQFSGTTNEVFTEQITNPVRLNIFSVHLKLFELKRRRSGDGRS